MMKEGKKEKVRSWGALGLNKFLGAESRGADSADKVSIHGIASFPPIVP